MRCRSFLLVLSSANTRSSDTEDKVRKNYSGKSEPNIARKYFATNICITAADRVLWQRGHNQDKNVVQIKSKYCLTKTSALWTETKSKSLCKDTPIEICPHWPCWTVSCSSQNGCFQPPSMDHKKSKSTMQFFLNDYLDMLTPVSAILQIGFLPEWRFWCDKTDASKDLSGANLGPSLPFTQTCDSNLQKWQH